MELEKCNKISKNENYEYGNNIMLEIIKNFKSTDVPSG